MSNGELGSPTPEGDDWEPHLGSLLGGIVVGAVLLGAVWMLVAFLSGSMAKGTSPDIPDPSATPSDGPTTASQPAGATRLERCTTAAAAVERSLRAARPALDQWDVHIGAMNKLVVGAITLTQATAFWNQTRVGAYDRIDRFQAADAQLERRGVDCPAPRLLGSGASPALRGCARHVAAELRALGGARTAIATWNHHMQAMDQLRAGSLSPTAATTMWLSMWQRGVHELQGFRDAEDAARNDGSCGGAAGSPQPSASPSVEPTSPASPASSASSESPMPGMDMH